MGYAAASTSTFTNLYYGECYPRTNHSVVASYWIPSGIGTVRVRCSCGGAVSPNPPPSFGPGPIGGNQTFTITHIGTGSHTIITDIVVGTTTFPGDEVTVNIGDPCPVSVRAAKEYSEGHLIVDPTVAPSGTFNGKLGNAVHLLIDDPPKICPGGVPRTQLTFADVAAVELNGEESTWKHPIIKNAKKGQHLRVVLTKDGVVVSVIRAVFK